MKARLLLGLFFASLAFNIMRITGPVDWRMIAAPLAGWWFADFLSGLVHMWMDCRPCVADDALKELHAWVGSRASDAFMARQAEVYDGLKTFERIHVAFKKHHVTPDVVGHLPLFHLIKAPTFFSALPMSLALNVVVLFWRSPGWALLGAVIFLLGGSLTAYFHSVLHRAQPPWPIRLMRALHLLMNPATHKAHHATMWRDFGVISGWSNPVLNPIVGVLRRTGVLDEAALVTG